MSSRRPSSRAAPGSPRPSIIRSRRPGAVEAPTSSASPRACGPRARTMSSSSSPAGPYAASASTRPATSRTTTPSISSRVTHARSACGRPPTRLQAPCWCVRSTSPGASRPDNDSRNRRAAPMEPSMEAESFSPGYHPAFERGEVELHTIEPTVHEQSDLREFVGLVKRHAPLIALVTIATAVAAFAMSLSQQSVYESSTTLLYSPTSTAAGNPTDTATEMETISGIATSTSVLAPIAQRFGVSLQKLQQDVSVGVSSSSGSTSELLKISARAHHATSSASIANAVAASLASFRATREKSLLNSQITFMRQQLNTLSGKTDPSSVAAASDIRTQLVNLKASLATFSPDLTVLTPAMVPGAAISPKPTRNGAIGLIVGLVLGIMLGVLRDRLDRRTRSLEEVEAVYRAPLLGTVPFNRRSAPRAELLADFAGSDLLAHAYRTIRTNLSLFRLDKTKKSVIVVTSAVPSEGKSAVAANLAHALSVTGLKVLAVSADLHDPTLHDYFADRVPTAGAPMIPILQRSDVLRAQAAQQREPAGLVQVLAGDMSLAEGARSI